MKITKITQRIGRTIKFNDNDYVKLDVTKEALLDQYIVDGELKQEDPDEAQQALFEAVKNTINKQKDALEKARKEKK